MYFVIARKYRPQTFEDVVGQEAVVATLKNAITSDRVHHAYLFAGARGIGKTSLARIYAKAINCEKGPSAIPCNQCSLCKEITAGSCLDVQEIDGASNTSVEDVRELREGLKFLPASARKKIYIIDEVHMLSGSAFNALLKTLEEPPPHVIFMFATTEVHKIPATILSRCQRFDLRRISSEKIFSKLESICAEEKVTYEKDALLMIVREAEGSLRDAQSLLDQAIAYSGGRLEVSGVASMLGLVNTQHLQQITEAVLTKQTERALKIAQEVYETGHDLKQFAIQWLMYWRNLLVYQATQEVGTLLDLTESELEAIQKQSKMSHQGALDIGFHLLQKGCEDIARSEFPKMLLDVLVVRLSHMADLMNVQDLLTSLHRQTPLSADMPGLSVSTPQAIEKHVTSSSHPVISDALHSAALNIVDFIKRVSSKRPQIGSMLAHVHSGCLSGNELILECEPNDIWLDLLTDKKDQLDLLAQEFYGRPIRVVLQDHAIASDKGEIVEISDKKKLKEVAQDPMVHSAIQILNAKIEEVKS
ncbi:MAG: DNA polymerase III subunit gamma/tau [Deltaproteobacteria bacterium]|nr:DNA polymerase III subunit gamma/tau [Deltaproteobacteria bacterium]